MFGIQALQERRDYGRHPSAALAEYLEVLGGDCGGFPRHTSFL
jgi:hypothetical protein